tara:strand:+ start:91075 stop:91590 length:516 start_codon:yes stop_codon:yes gene_type:complete
MTATGTISIVKPKTAPSPDIGDILDGADFLAELLTDEQADQIRAHDLSLVHENHWIALERLGIDAAELIEQVKYECPFRPGTFFFHMYPLYISRLYPSEVRDWYKIMVETEPQDDSLIRAPFASNVDHSFMGHGYSKWILPHDGGGKWCWAKISLSDGRWLLVQYFEWYNK